MKCDICNIDFKNEHGNIVIQKNIIDGKYYCWECAFEKYEKLNNLED